MKEGERRLLSLPQIGVIVLLITLVFGFVFILIIALTILVGLYYSPTLESVEPSVYRYLQWDHTNETTSGFITSFQKLENGYETEIDESGNLIMMSNFGTDEYKCFGTCFCSNDMKRRNSKVVVSRGMRYLVAAVSTTLALSKANEFFLSECNENYAFECGGESISSKVDSCQSFSENGGSFDNEGRDVRKYLCSGKCKRNNRFRIAESKKLVEEFDCASLTVEGKVTVDCTENEPHLNNCYAVQKFHKEFMVPFCKEKSKTTYWYNNKKNQYGQYKTSAFCVAGSPMRTQTYCRQIYPPYQDQRGDNRLTYQV